jgi:hypothetical protein
MGGPDYDSDKSEDAIQPDDIHADGQYKATSLKKHGRPNDAAGVQFADGNGISRTRKPRSLSAIQLRPLNADDLEENKARSLEETEDDMGVLDDYSDSDVRRVPFQKHCSAYLLLYPRPDAERPHSGYGKCSF